MQSTNFKVEVNSGVEVRIIQVKSGEDVGSEIYVAQLTRHDVQTLYENYAGNVNNLPRLPEIIL